MTKRLHVVALVTAAGALLAIPSIGQANKPDAQGNHNHPNTGRSCQKKPTVNKGFVVKGTLVTYAADNSTTTGTNEANVAITVTGANRHARRAGVSKGGAYSADGTPGTPPVTGNDPFKVELSGYESGPTDIPAAGDKVRVIGKVAVTRKKCAAPGASLEDRYGTVNIRKVKIVDATP